MDFGSGFEDTTLFNNPYTPNQSLVSKYNVAYTTAGNVTP